MKAIMRFPRSLAIVPVLVAAVLLGIVVTRAQPPGASMSQPAIELPPAVIETIRAIYSVGEAYGNRSTVFSKVGDSITVSVNFLQPIAWRAYNLDAYAALEPVVAHFWYQRVGEGNSYNNASYAAAVGWAAWGALEPRLANPDACLPDENPLECEYRIVRPAYAIILFGTNDANYRTPEQFAGDMERIMRTSFSWGVIPIFTTTPPRPDAMSTIEAYNAALRALTSAHNLPLIDYHTAMLALPDLGLTWDALHPSSPDATEFVVDFRPDYLQYGYNVRNLLTLQMLDAVWRATAAP
jgi:hypothetical protein